MILSTAEHYLILFICSRQPPGLSDKAKTVNFISDIKSAKISVTITVQLPSLLDFIELTVNMGSNKTLLHISIKAYTFFL